MTATARREPLRQVLPWLVLALALHAGLLWIPLADRARTEPTWATVELHLAPSEPPAQPEPERATPATAAPNALTVPPPATAPQARETRAPLPAVVDREPRVPLERQPWSLAPAKEAPHPRVLGDAPPGGRPEAWTRPLLPSAPNLFDRAVVPREVEIVDRWQSADGGHRVVIKSPDGETYCGRAPAYDPLHPEFEPIMTWHRCAGGGTRTDRGEAIDFRATP